LLSGSIPLNCTDAKTTAIWDERSSGSDPVGRDVERHAQQGSAAVDREQRIKSQLLYQLSYAP
jgi:hypothetical protein